MPLLTCNIERRGRIARAICGAVFVALAVAVGFGILPIETRWIRLALAIPLGLLGAFQLFEAAAGWCIVRALGGRTPM